MTRDFMWGVCLIRHPGIACQGLLDRLLGRQSEVFVRFMWIVPLEQPPEDEVPPRSSLKTLHNVT